MRIETIFMDEMGNLRSGWRCVFFIFAYLFSTAILISGASLILRNLPIGLYDTSNLLYLVGFGIQFLTAVLLGWLAGKYFENLPFRALGVSPVGNWWKNLFYGLFIGSLTLILAVIIPIIFGNSSITVNPVETSAVLLTLADSLVIFIIAAAFEESLFRGYIFQTLTRANLAWAAIVSTSVFFGAVHLGNQNANWISTMNTVLAGIWLAIAYLKTRDLWFPFGIHLMWNWTQGAIFGIPVSGSREFTNAPLLQTTDGGPNWLTGGEYGIEGGIACTLAILAATAAIYFIPFIKTNDEILIRNSIKETELSNAVLPYE